MQSFTPIVSPEVFSLRPDYAALSLVVDVATLPSHSDDMPLRPQIPSDPAALSALHAHLEAWRGAYRAFGANPRRYLCSAEALIGRLESAGGLSAIHPIVDAYNAVSVRFGLPIGGEDAMKYRGVPRLVRAVGEEQFDTIQMGQPVTESVPGGEVVWRDDMGVTCRRWNWRQCVRTRITAATTRAWFVLERLEPLPVATLIDAGRVLYAAVAADGAAARADAALIDRAGIRPMLPEISTPTS